MAPRPAAPRLAAPETTTGPTARFLAKAAFLAAAGLVTVVPLVFSRVAFEMFRGPKSDLAFALWAVLAAAAIGLGGRRVVTDGWQWPALAVLAAGIASAPAARNPAGVLAALVPVAVASLGIAALRRLDVTRRERLEGFVVIGAVAVAALTVLFTLPAWRPASFTLLADLHGRYARIGTLGNPGDVGVFLVLPCLLAAALALERPGRRRWLAATAATILAATILFTETLTALAALAAGVIALVWPLLRPRARLAGGAAALATVLLLLSVTPLRERVRVAAGEVSRFGWAGLGSFRLAGWSAALGLAARHPVTGVGFDSFEATSFAAVPEAIRAERGRYLGMVTAFGEAHNEPLQLLAETGLFGILLVAGALWLAVKRGGSPSLPRGGLALPVAAAVLFLTQFPLHQAASAAQWLVLAALALPALTPPPRPPRLVLVIVLVAAATGAGFVAWRHHREGVGLQQGKWLAEGTTALSPDKRRLLASRAHDNLERVIALRAPEWRSDVVLGNLAFAASTPGIALAHFERALARAERPENFFNAGIARIANGDRDGGITALVAAAELNPAVLRELRDGDLALAVRARLEASGFAGRYPWIFDKTPAARATPAGGK